MDSIEELNKLALRVSELTQHINDETHAFAFAKAPVIVHQRICHEVTKLAKEHKGKPASEVEGFVDLLTALSVVEELYPQTKEEHREDEST